MRRSNKVRVDMVTLWCVLSLLTFLSVEASGTNPGAKLRVTQKGLDYELEISINPLREKLKTIQIPNMSGKEEVLFMDVSYRVSSMQIEEVLMDSTAVGLVPGTGVSLSIGKAYIDLKGNWEVEYLFIDDGGWFTLSIFDIRISTTIGVNNDGQGHPTVYAASCSASIGRVEIDLHGGLSWLYQLFDSYINSALLDALQPQICTMVTEAINSINPHLKTLNVLAQVDKYAEIDYSIVGSPFVSYSGIDLGLKGEFYNIGQHQEPPFSPTPFSLPAQDSNMLYIALSAFSLNSAGFVYNNAGVLKLYITDDMIPSSCPFRLDTKTFGIFIPQIAKQYPGLKMEFLLKAAKEPNISFEPNLMTLEASSTVSAYAIQPNATLSPLFILNMNASVSALIYVSGLKVLGKVTLKKIDLTLNTSNVGPIQVKLLDNVAWTILNVAVIPRVNALLKNGYPLPAIGEMNLRNTQLQILKDYVLIGTDVQFGGVDLPDVL
ncbi:bactericidal permeability-increasing protein-like isoform X2 [Tachysurus fulvidraco]|uniref:bactericidal permeability-increasing protein-like isoform X2 n=1 Tax=Tachysurus fulvidraco TaxID=1234273 RepID=UPI001FEF2FD4|nr:bactericidal permeability-increasing protein-like isoform X2 [Tachysurus fulvidraco]